jgi:hypothetical protein
MSPWKNVDLLDLRGYHEEDGDDKRGGVLFIFYTSVQRHDFGFRRVFAKTTSRGTTVKYCGTKGDPCVR